jgi:hypothetical protein
MIDKVAIGNELLRYAPLIMTVVGWWYVNSQSNRRETRKEHRALIDASKREVANIANEAAEYRCDVRSDLAPKIKWSLQALEIDLERLPGFFPTSEIMKGLMDFSDACTGGDFEMTERVAHLAESEEVRSIFAQRNLLIQHLEKWFRSQYY